MKIRLLLIIAMITGVAFYLGRLSIIGIDVLCSSSFQPAQLLTDMTDNEGHHLPAGTIISYRSCEKASQARFNFLIDHADVTSVEALNQPNSPSYSMYPHR